MQIANSTLHKQSGITISISFSCLWNHMDLLYPDLICLLVDNYLETLDALSFCRISKKFYPYGHKHRQILADARNGWSSCVSNGKLAACQLYHKIHKNDLMAGFHWAFRISCHKGHLNLAKWLASLEIKQYGTINIHEFCEEAFKWLEQIGQESGSPMNYIV